MWPKRQFGACQSLLCLHACMRLMRVLSLFRFFPVNSVSRSRSVGLPCINQEKFANNFGPRSCPLGPTLPHDACQFLLSKSSLSANISSPLSTKTTSTMVLDHDSCCVADLDTILHVYTTVIRVSFLPARGLLLCTQLHCPNSSAQQHDLTQGCPLPSPSVLHNSASR